MHVVRSFVVVAVAVALAPIAGCGGERPASCGEVQARLLAVVAADQRRAETSVNSDFLPVLDRSVAEELAARCRAGQLTDAARRCLAHAKTAVDLDRCVARLERGR